MSRAWHCCAPDIAVDAQHQKRQGRIYGKHPIHQALIKSDKYSVSQCAFIPHNEKPL